MNHFVADGAQRSRESLEFLAKETALRQAIEAQYAAELSAAGLIRHCLLQIRMKLEIYREIRRIMPSAESLY